MHVDIIMFPVVKDKSTLKTIILLTSVNLHATLISIMSVNSLETRGHPITSQIFTYHNKCISFTQIAFFMSVNQKNDKLWLNHDIIYWEKLSDFDLCGLRNFDTTV